MKPTIIPLMKGALDWEPFLLRYEQEAGHNPLKILKSVNVSDEAALLVALSEEGNRYEAISKTKHLKHLHLGFYLVCDDSLLLALAGAKITISKVKGGAIATATLDTWKQFVLDYSKDGDFDTRFMANWAYILFQRLKIDDVFVGFKRRKLKDETFILE
jgi:hypothetical protein